MKAEQPKWVEVKRTEHPWLVYRDEKDGNIDRRQSVASRYFCPEGALWPMVSLSVRPSTLSREGSQFENWALVTASYKEDEDSYWDSHVGFPMVLLPQFAEIAEDYINL